MEERRRWIEALIRKDGEVSVTRLERDLGVSSMTARRDLDALAGEGKVERIYGGAVLPMVAAREDSFHWRVDENREAKERLAKAALELIEPGETLFVDSSTTVLYLVKKMMAEGVRATLLTNSVAVQQLFAGVEVPALELVVVGGELKKPTLSLVGPNAVRGVGLYLADKVFVSTWGVEADGALTDPDVREADVKRAMLRQTDHPVLMIDGSKFERRGMHVYAHASEFSTILATDASEMRLRRLSEAGPDVRSA